MENISIYKNIETGKYHKFFSKDVSDIKDADKYTPNNGLITASNTYIRVKYEYELILLRKKKLIKLNVI